MNAATHRETDTFQRAMLFNGSSEHMHQLDDESVALTVTSPPYWNAIDYDLHAQRGEQHWYRSRQYSQGYDDFEQYLDLMERIFHEVKRVTRPGGYVAIVVGTVLEAGRHLPLPHLLTSRLTSAGTYELHAPIIWNKVTGGVKRAGSFIQQPYPGYYYPNIMTEYILIFRKPGPQFQPTKENHPLDFPNTHLDDHDSVWHIAPVPPRTLEHPCPFPEEIPHRLILKLSNPDDVVLDPFLGSGQTTKVALHLDRRAVGYDIQPEYVEYAKRRLNEPLHVRNSQLLMSVRETPSTSGQKDR